MNLQDGKWLDSMYNNRALVPDYAKYFERWTRDSEAARRDSECVLDIPYGTAAGEKLDVFPAAQARSQTLVFLHGGYWRSLDKSDFSFIGPVFQEAGACVVVPNYDLCPAVTIPDIALQVARAVAWTWKHAPDHGGDPRQITLVGHSAGGHLVALMLACDWRRLDPDLPSDTARKALSISGLFDLEPMRHTPFLKDSLRLTPEDALRASPAYMPAPQAATLYAVAGAEESAEFHRHNDLIRQAWGPDCVEVVEALDGLNHFSVLDGLVTPGHALQQLALELLWR